jgi:YHS domain-containing protein
MIMKSATTVKDPVCGMDIETATAAGRTEHNGQTYYFCGSKCKEKFDLNPEQYVGKSAGTSTPQMNAMPTVDPSFRQAWLLWASVFPVSWTALCVAWPALRRITL